MIVEMKLARTHQIWIDGVAPTKEWVVDDDPDTGRISMTEGNGQPLRVGPHLIDWIEFMPPQGEWHDDNEPKQAVIQYYRNGTVLRTVEAKFKNHAWGSADEDEAFNTVIMHSGEKLVLDEITAYVKLEVSE